MTLSLLSFVDVNLRDGEKGGWVGGGGGGGGGGAGARISGLGYFTVLYHTCISMLIITASALAVAIYIWVYFQLCQNSKLTLGVLCCLKFANKIGPSQTFKY